MIGMIMYPYVMIRGLLRSSECKNEISLKFVALKHEVFLGFMNTLLVEGLRHTE